MRLDLLFARAVSILVAWFCLSPTSAAQKVFPSTSTTPPSSKVDRAEDFGEVVVPITSVKIAPSAKMGFSGKLVPNLGINANFGTGFCLDAACRFIATNYHVAMATRAKKIKGEWIIERYLATGPSDQDATANPLPNQDVLGYATKRDLAIFELRRSLPHHHGLTFSLDELEIGQEVDIYGYPKGSINPIRKLTRFPATFKAPTTSGLLAFDYQLSSDKPIRIGGASGGIVVDRKTERIVGILCETTETAALAVPVEALVDFVSKVQPFLAQKIFPATKEVSPASADLYPKFAPPPDLFPKFIPQRADAIQHRPVEPDQVVVLRQKAQLLADSMRNYIAVQNFAWGSGDKEPSAQAAYEVRVIDGVQRYRMYPDGKKQSEDAPWPSLNAWTNPANEWATLPTMVGTEYRLKVQQAPDRVVNGRRMKVFQYYSSVEDNQCPFEPIEIYVFFVVRKTVAVACYGEVWTDEDTNIIRISQHLDLSDKLKAYKGWETHDAVLTYGWVNRADDWLVPLTIYIESRDKKRTYWCRGHFTDYHVFTASGRIIRR